MDALGNDDAVLVTLHFFIAAGGAIFEVVPGNVGLHAVQQLGDADQQGVHVHTVGGLPVCGLGRALVQRQEEVVHAQQTHLDAQILQVLLKPHGGGGLAGAGGARQGNHRLFLAVGQNGGGCGADLVVKYLLTAQNKLRLVAHGIIDIFQVDNAHRKMLLSIG